MSKLTSNLSNGYSTGGGGFDFERRVQAILLLTLVMNGFSPVLKRPIERVSFQTKRNGLNTDDLLVVSENDDAKLLCQMKHDLAISRKNGTFQQVVNAAWADFKSVDFRQNKDKIALITGFIAKDSVDALRIINETALTSVSANGFTDKLQQSNFHSNKTREKLAIIKHCLKKANGNNPISDDELWQFCKCFVLLVFDVDYTNGVNESLVKTLIKCKSSVDASSVWSKLQDVAGFYNRIGADITLKNLDEEILTYFGLYSNNEQVNEQENVHLNGNVHINGFVPSEFWAKLAILGSWDENNNCDMEVIQELFGISYDDFEKQMQTYLANDDYFISLSSGIWEIKHRQQLFEFCDKFYFDKTIVKAFDVTSKVLAQIDKHLTDTREVTHFSAKSGNFDNSNSIRKGLAQGLCILSNLCSLKNCSKEKLLREKDNFILNIFETCNWKKIVSLNELLYTISEISPKVYLMGLEKYIGRDPHGIEKLFPKTQSSWLNNNYICYLLWSIEVLAWHEDYLIDSIRCLGELSSLNYEETNFSNTPINSILAILMPWYPQTLASVQKQLNAINLLVREFPQIGWKVLKGLMPSVSTSVTSGILKPKYLKLEIPEKISVDKAQTYRIYNDCFSLALQIASNDAQKISDLVKCISYIGLKAIKDLLSVIQENIDSWTDSQKFSVWMKLSDYKYQVIGDNNNLEPESELFSLLKETVGKLAPKDCYYKNRRLFLSYFNECTFFIDDDKRWQKLNQMKSEAVEEVYNIYGVDGVYKFGTEINKEYEVFPIFGHLINREDLENILVEYLNEKYSSVFVHYTIDGFVSLNGVKALEQIGLGKYGVGFISEILTHLNFSAELLTVVNSLLPSDDNLFWSKAVMPVCYYSDCDYDFKYVVDKLIENKRFAVIVNMIGKSREVPPIDEEMIYDLLEKAITVNQEEKLDSYAVQRLIKRLQDSERRDVDGLSGIEFLYLPWLDEHSRTQPKALKTKIANSPEYFCQIIELAFKKHNSEEHQHINENFAQRLYDIIFKFDVIPGTDWNGVFNCENFNSWISYVIDWSIKNDREAVTKQTIGSGLSYAKILPNGTFDEAIIKVLDAKENNDIREGYMVGVFNQRGIYWVDPEGKPERALAAKYEEMADSVEALGYSRFSNTLRRIAQSYLKEAEHNVLASQMRTED